MNRRRFLSLSIPALVVALAGCSQDSERGTETATPSPADSDPGCWPSMCAGTQIIEVDVTPDAAGTAVLEASCRDEAVSMQPGESARLVREADAEECGVTLFVDDERVYDERVDGHVSVTVTVGPTGRVDEERVTL